MLSRRTFVKTGIAAALALATGTAAWRVLEHVLPHRFSLDAAGREMLTALVPALLGPVLPAQPQARQLAVATTVEHVSEAIAGLPLATQAELRDLFGVLTLAPARRLAGLPPWRDATPAQLDAFLEGWRLHRHAMLRTAYQGLHDLVLGSWYATPAAWHAIGYPGPPPELAS